MLVPDVVEFDIFQFLFKSSLISQLFGSESRVSGEIV